MTTTLTVRFQRISSEATLPTKAHAADACFDLYSAHYAEIYPGATAMVSTGFKVAVPERYVGLVCSRSGYASKGLVVANAPGIVDDGYRGELKVLLHNNTEERWIIRQGDRIAQFMIQKVLPTVCQEVDTLDYNTERGEGGFGSSGT